MNKEDFFSKLKNKCLDDDDMQRTKENIKIFDFKNGEELTKLYLKSHVFLLADVFEKLLQHLLKNMEVILYIVWVYLFTWQCGMKYTDIKIQTLHDKGSILTLENTIRGGISSVLVDRYVKSCN